MQAQDFRQQGTQMRRKMWFQNMKVKLIVLGILIALILIIVLSVCGGKCWWVLLTLYLDHLHDEDWNSSYGFTLPRPLTIIFLFAISHSDIACIVRQCMYSLYAHTLYVVFWCVEGLWFLYFKNFALWCWNFWKLQLGVIHSRFVVQQCLHSFFFWSSRFVLSFLPTFHAIHFYLKNHLPSNLQELYTVFCFIHTHTHGKILITNASFIIQEFLLPFTAVLWLQYIYRIE